MSNETKETLENNCEDKVDYFGELSEKIKDLPIEKINEIIENAKTAADQEREKIKSEKEFQSYGEWKSEFLNYTNSKCEINVSIPEKSEKVLIKISGDPEQKIELDKKVFSELVKLLNTVGCNVFTDDETNRADFDDLYRDCVNRKYNFLYSWFSPYMSYLN